MKNSIMIKSFEELSKSELYDILRLRQQVFVVEQSCPYLDCDDLDQQSFHVMLSSENELQAYARILPPGSQYKNSHLSEEYLSHFLQGEKILGMN